MRMAARYAKLLQICSTKALSKSLDAQRWQGLASASIGNRHHSQQVILHVPANPGGKFTSDKGFDALHTIDLNAGAEDGEGATAEGRSSGRYLRDPKEWVWMPPVPQKLADWQQTSRTDGTTSAFQWLCKCQPQLPQAAVYKLFRKREVRLVESAKSADQPAVLRRISNAESLPPGSVLVIHVRTVEPRAPCPKKAAALKRLAAAQKPTKHSKVEKMIASKAGAAVVRPGNKVMASKGGAAVVRPEIQDLRDRVLFRDEHLVVLNKAHGQAVQGGRSVKQSLDDLLAEAFGKSGRERPRLVHRLDKDTSGCLIVALSEQSAAAITALFRNKTAAAISSSARDAAVGATAERTGLQRTYWALVEGIPAQAEAVIDTPVKKCEVPGKGEHMVLADRRDEAALPALTWYRIAATNPQGFAWLELQPLTGRKHQLRVHASHVLSCPIVGDYKYGFVGQVRNGREKDGTVRVLDTEKKGRGRTVKASKEAVGDAGSASPRLHLHCRWVELPKLDWVGTAKEAKIRLESAMRAAKRTQVEAPLPPHMEASWKALNFPMRSILNCRP